MSESLGSELSYGEPLEYPVAESDSLSIPNEREHTEAEEQLPDSTDPHTPSTVPDSQNENRLSLVSATTLEPRRRTRHHSGRHSHMHRDLAHMLSVSARDAKELRRGLNTAYNKLDQSRERASHAEKLAVDMLLRVREAEEEREKAMREASAIHEDLGRYKALLDSAHGEIRRGQRLLQDQENLRYEAEADAARARDNARQMKQRRLVELAREQGRKMGYDEGVQAGQRIGYYDGQGPDDATKVYFNEGPRFREVFDESNYRLDSFDQPPPIQPNASSSNGPGVLPRATDPPYTDSQEQYDEIPVIPHDTSIPPPEVPYTSPQRRVQRAPSTDSSSTTTLPAAPVPLRAPSRAPPTMPTIPEVASTEVGSASLRSRSLRDSPRMHDYIQPVPQAPAHNGVLPSIVTHIQDPATFEPPPGSVSPVSPLAPGYSSHNDVYPSIVYPLQDRVAFEPPPGSVGVSPALAPQASLHDDALPSNFPAMQDGTAFQPPPGSVMVSPSLAPQAHDAVLPSFVAHPQDRATFQPPPGSMDEASTAPVRASQGPAEQLVYAFPSPHRGYANFLNGSSVPAPEGFRSPVQERFASAPEANPSQVQGRHASVTRNAPSPAQESFPRTAEYPSSRVRERFPSTHSRRNSRSHSESVQLADELRNPEYPTRVRSDGSTSRRDGPPKRRPIPQMPAPLAPQSAPNRSYSQGSQSSVRHRRPSEFDHGMPRDAGMDDGPNIPVDRHYSPPEVISSPVERPSSRTPVQHSGATSHQSHDGQRSGHSTVRDPYRDLNAARDPHPRSSTVRDPHSGLSSVGNSNPGPSTVRDPNRGPSTVHDPSHAAPHFIPSGAGQQSAPRSPRVRVQIPPGGYYAPDPASHLAELSPTAHDQMPPADIYSPGAAPSSSNPNVSDSQFQSPSRFPPTLYNEPRLQQQSSRSADYQQGQTASSPTLPVPSRNSRTTSHVMTPPPANPSRRNSYATRQGRVTDSPNTPTEALPIPPPSLSPHPSPATFSRQFSGAVMTSTPRRSTSPNPLPRSSSPVPLPRASSPAPLPIRSPSFRSTHIRRNASDVSLPGAPGSPYTHYNPNQEADIAVLASSSAEILAAPTR